VDLYYERVLEVEKEYNKIRRNLPAMLQGSAELIEGLESQEMCQYLQVDDVDMCEQAGD